MRSANSISMLLVCRHTGSDQFPSHYIAMDLIPISKVLSAVLVALCICSFLMRHSIWNPASKVLAPTIYDSSTCQQPILQP